MAVMDLILATPVPLGLSSASTLRFLRATSAPPGKGLQHTGMEIFAFFCENLSRNPQVKGWIFGESRVLRGKAVSTATTTRAPRRRRGTKAGGRGRTGGGG